MAERGVCSAERARRIALASCKQRANTSTFSIRSRIHRLGSTGRECKLGETARWEPRQPPPPPAVLLWLLRVFYTSTFLQRSRLSAHFHLKNDFSWRCTNLRPDKEERTEKAALPWRSRDTGRANS